MLNITKGKINRAQKVVIYGPEGIGKSSLAAKFPEPLFIDTEGGTAQMDVRRIDKPQRWEDLLAVVQEVAVTPNVCKSLILDTADWAEQLIVDYLCTKYKQNSIESFGYGKGYTYLAEEFTRLLNGFDQLLTANIHVVVTAHAKMRKFEQPDEMGAYDRWEMKLSKQVAPLLKEWCDLLLFCNYQTFVVTSENNTQKAQGGKRVMYTSHHPAWDAKNRVQLPDVLELDYKHLAHIFAELPSQPMETKAAEQTSADALREVMEKYGVSEDEVRQVVAARGKYPATTGIDDYPDEFVFGYVIKYWDQIMELIEQSRKAKQ